MIKNFLEIPPISENLQQKRQSWQTAYKQKDIKTMEKIETNDFFVLHFHNVIKKNNWHQEIVIQGFDNDPLLKLYNAEKTRHDFPDEASCVMTSFFKNDDESQLVKEIWVNHHGDWQIGSLAITHIRQNR